MKKTALCLALLGLLALGGQAFAVICTIDDVPAATLLLPYFEVDLTNANGVNTLFSVNNASASAVLAHVVVYSDLSVPVLDFNIYLTGYDVQTVSLRDILVGGNLPRTAPPPRTRARPSRTRLRPRAPSATRASSRRTRTSPAAPACCLLRPCRPTSPTTSAAR
jgi:hypothetical protein